MADNFNLRQFLTENKLTKNAKLLAEGKFSDSYKSQAAKDASYEIRNQIVNNLQSTKYEDLEGIVDKAIQATGEEVSPAEKAALLKHANWILTYNTGMEFEGVEEDVEYDPSSDQGMFQQYMPPAQYIPKKSQEDKPQPEKKGFLGKVKSMVGLKESTLSPREKYLTRLVESALGLDTDDMEDNVSNDDAYAKAFETMGEGEEMVTKKPVPSYKSIEELMKEIDHGTNGAACKYKMEEMKRIAQALEEKVSSLEEGEGADFVDSKKVKQMKKDIMTLRKQAEKLEKEYDKKFGEKKSKKEEN